MSLALALVLASGPVTAPVAPAQPPAPSVAPPPYSLPWLLRPAAPATVVRIDETLAFYEDPSTGARGASYLTGLIASYRLSPRWVPVFRFIWTRNDAPSRGRDTSGNAFSNPLVGINYLRPFGRVWRWTGFFASNLPVGSGGGATPDRGAAAAQSAAIPARSAMDNALFAVNYWTVIGGLGLARVTPHLTFQGEVTILQLTRVRGPETQDESRTNMTAGAHAGHFFSPRMSVGAEVRLQRWLSNAAPVRSDPRAREQFTFAVGPRFHFKLGKGRWLRPGLSYSRAFDDPMKAKSYDILQVDVPLAF